MEGSGLTFLAARRILPSITVTIPKRQEGGRDMDGTKSSFSRALKAAFPATVPVMTGYLCLGFAYGVLDLQGMKEAILSWQ